MLDVNLNFIGLQRARIIFKRFKFPSRAVRGICFNHKFVVVSFAWKHKSSEKSDTVKKTCGFILKLAISA